MFNIPTIYLSPSTQEFNPYISGGNEEMYMNLITDAMEPYLEASNILFTRNTPSMTAASSIRQANAGEYDFYIALHSNASPPSKSGSMRGTDVYYYSGSEAGQRMADIMVSNIKKISPTPEKVKAVATTTLGEVGKTNAPSVLVEIAYHDNFLDAAWITGNIIEIAANLVLSITEYFGVPFVTP